jgi:hypothetical protein
MHTISEGSNIWTFNNKGLKDSGLTTAQLLALSMTVADAGTVRYNTDTGSLWSWNGTGWVGETLWTVISLAAGWTGTVEYKRLLNHTIVFRGNAIRTGATTSFTPLLTMPAGFRIQASTYASVVYNDSTIPQVKPNVVYLENTGTIYCAEGIPLITTDTLVVGSIPAYPLN